MNIFDWLEAGNEMLSVGRAVLALGVMEKINPDSIPIYRELKESCEEGKLNFSIGGTKEGQLFFMSNSLNKSFFDTPKFRCLATINPELLQVLFSYSLDYGEFVTSNVQGHYLQNWINQRLAIGKMIPGHSRINSVGKEVQNFSYIITIDCGHVPIDNLETLFNNAIARIIDFREIYMPIIKLVRDFKLSLDAKGEFSGQGAARVLQTYQQTRARLARRIVPENKAILDKRLQDMLVNAGYEFQLDEGQYNFTTQTTTEQESPLSFQAFVTQQGDIEFQLSSTVHEDQGETIQCSQYLTFINRQSTGKYFYNHFNQQMVFRNSLPLAGLENRFSPILITHLLLGCRTAYRLYFPRFQFVTQPNLYPQDILAQNLDASQIDFSMFSKIPADYPEVTDQDVSESTEEADQVEDQPATPTLPNLDQKQSPPESIEVAAQLVSERSEEAEQIKVHHTTPTPPSLDQEESPSEQTRAPTAQKDHNIALILEGLLGLIGFLGVGWLYSGNFLVGGLILVGYLFWDLFALILIVATVGVGIFCIIPLHLIFVGVSTIVLYNYTKQHQEIFKNKI